MRLGVEGFSVEAYWACMFFWDEVVGLQLLKERILSLHFLGDGIVGSGVLSLGSLELHDLLG